jgi:hypothetical protein
LIRRALTTDSGSGLNDLFQVGKAVRTATAKTIVCSWMPSCGWSLPACRGAICLKSSISGTELSDVSDDGPRRASGKRLFTAPNEDSDLEDLIIDSITARSHPHAAGAQKGKRR